MKCVECAQKGPEEQHKARVSAERISSAGPQDAVAAPVPYFPWRGWAICVEKADAEGMALFAEAVGAACERAADYGMNLLEFHDYACPGGIVDAVISYQDFPRLCSPFPDAQREAQLSYFAELAAGVKARGLELNAWYHVFRNAPQDLAERYPDVTNVDRPFVWEFIAQSIDEFFDLLPEVDRLTITSLHETPSIMAAQGAMSRTDRLIKLYLTIHQACRRRGKGMVLRDFMSRGQDLATFWSILDQLPQDLVLMTKEVLVDWRHVGLPLTPNLMRYVGRPFVVEMDLYGEYQGRATVPWCHPEYVHRVIRELLPFCPQGVTARILHVTHRPHPHRTVFHSPNDVNLHALGRFLHNPGPQLGPENRWHSDYGQMDAGLWLEWATRKYGAAAAIPVIRALRRTPRIVELNYDLAGTTYQKHSSYPSPSEAAATVSQPAFWTAAVNVSLDERLDRVGLEFLRDEKREALRLARCSLADIREAGSALVPEEYRLLLDLFEGTILLIRGVIAHLETWSASRVPAGEQPEEVRKAFRAACRRARAVSGTMRRRFGEQFFGGTPDALDRLVEAAEARSCARAKKGVGAAT